MGPLTLSRSSRLYKFVFGHEEGKLEGFPEPRNDRISSGLFLVLLLALLIGKPLGTILLLIFDVMLRAVGFLIDGSWVYGSIRHTFQIRKIEPWPRMKGKRLSPFLVLAVAVTGYQYYNSGIKDAGEVLLGCIFMVVVFLNIDPGSKSPAQQLAEAAGPKVDEKIRLSYYREPRWFPVLKLIK